jgi:hypothetical protein
MKEFKIGDRVQVKGDTQHYILADPDKAYDGEVIGTEPGQLLVRLNKPVTRGTVEFHEISVPPTMVSQRH